MSRVGNPEDDKNIYIPMKGAQELFDIKDEYITAIVKVKPNYETEKVAEDIEDALRKDRGLDEGEEDFQVQSLEQMMEATGIVLDAVQWVVIGIALISLFVGGIGIMNTMYTSVLERTQEVGVMKAVGARNTDILLLFLIESGTIGMVGGGVGCLIGIAISKGFEYIAVSQFDIVLIKASITPELILGALAFSFLIGSISGGLPARQAAQLKPVDALRYE
jgi:putative ABC transport system permease protein